MRLSRCKDQPSKTLEAFYDDLLRDENDAQRAMGRAMLGLIHGLRALPSAYTVFGLTSHSRLVLLAEDSFESPWLVIVSAHNEQSYFVEYLMPNALAPWPGAIVKGESHSLAEAVRMVEIAIERCEGW